MGIVVKLSALVVMTLALGACGFGGGNKHDADAGIDAEPDAREGLPSLIPEIKDYGQYVPGGPSQTWVFTVQAISPVGPLTTAIKGAAAADYVRLADGCNGMTLPGMGTCTVAVRFMATAQTGAREATLEVTDSGVI